MISNIIPYEQTGIPYDLTAEEITAKKVEEIFLPRVSAIRTRFFQDRRRFIHYTSADKAISIIRSKRFWLRNATAMTDYREVTHGFELLHGAFADKDRLKSFIAALDNCLTGIAQDAIDIYNQHRSNVLYQTYIAALSEHDDKEDEHGRLSMWRAFGGGSARVAIVLRVPFRLPGSELLNCFFSPVLYLNEIATEIDLVCSKLRSEEVFLRGLGRQALLDAVYSMLIVNSTCIKHPGFEEEREWRAVYSPNQHPSPLMEQSTETIGGVPQIVCKLPLDAAKDEKIKALDLPLLFDRLIIGPTAYAPPLFLAFQDALRSIGITNPKIQISGIPLRS